MDIDVSYVASENWDEAMPERLRWLRENDPVYWSEKDQFWVLTRYKDVQAVSKDQETFTSAEGVRPTMPVKIGLIDEGEPRHGRLRNLINRGFTPRMVKILEKKFLEITTEAIDAVAKKGECDFVEAISVPLPLLLIAEMIGIERDAREDFHRWSDAMIAAEGSLENPEVAQAAGLAFMEYSNYVAKIIEDRRANPRDDLISILVGAKDDGFVGELDNEVPVELGELSEEGEALAHDELTMLCVILLVAGNETTRNGLSGGMELLIEHPDQRQKLIDDPSLIPSAVEEIVRFVSPVHSFSRTVTRDTEFGGRTMLKGQKVLMIYPAANRDPEAFDDPDEFRVERNPRHLGFGIGNHFCLGANLARMELRVALEELLRRLPDMEYAAGGPEMRPSALVRTMNRMHVRFTPEP